MTVPGYVGNGAITDNTGTFPYPAGSTGDLLWLFWESDTAGDTPAATGWTVVKGTYASGNHAYGYAWKAASSASSGSQAFTGFSAGFYTGQFIRLSGADTTTPVDVSNLGTTNVSASLTTTGADRLQVVWLSYDSASQTFTAPSGWTRRQDGNGTENWYGATRPLASAGASGTGTFDNFGTVGNINVAIKPSSGGTVNGTLAQSSGFQELITGDRTKDGILAQSSGFQELITGTHTKDGILAQSSGFQQLLTGTLLFDGTLAQGFGFQELITGTVTKDGTLAQAFGFQELITGDVTKDGILAQGFGFQQLLNGAPTVNGILGQSFGFQELIIGVTTKDGTLVQSFGFQELITGDVTKDGILTQGFGFQQTIVGSGSVAGILSQTFGFQQVITGEIIFNGTLTQAIGFLQTLNGSGQIEGTLSQAIGFLQTLAGSGGGGIVQIWVQRNRRRLR